MSLHNASQSVATGSDELVPSRYALRVGEIDVLVISDGVFPLPAASLATNADPADLAAWLDYRLQPPEGCASSLGPLASRRRSVARNCVDDRMVPAPSEHAPWP